MQNTPLLFRPRTPHIFWAVFFGAIILLGFNIKPAVAEIDYGYDQGSAKLNIQIGGGFIGQAVNSPAQAAGAGVEFADQESKYFGMDVIRKPLGLGAKDLRVIAANIIKTFIGLLGIIFLCLILLVGFLWMTAGGSEEKAQEAKSTLLAAFVGLVIILCARSIAEFVINALLYSTGAQATL